MSSQNIIFNNNNMTSKLDEIKAILKGDIEKNGKKPYHPSPNHLTRNGKPTKKALAYNRRLLQEGKTFRYLDDTKFIKKKPDGKIQIINKKFTPKRKQLVKSQKNLKLMGDVIQNNNLTKQPVQSYVNNLKKEINNKKDAVGAVVNVDLKQIPLKDVLKIVSQFTTEKRKFTARALGSDKYITLSDSNISRLLDYESLAGSQFAERTGSDNQFIFELDSNPIIELTINPIKKQKPQGSFFNFYHVFSDMDWERYDVYSSKPENYNNNCLYNALKAGGLEQSKLNDMRCFVRSGSVPTCKLTDICNKLDIRIKLRKPYKDTTKVFNFGKSGQEFKIGLLHNHYFIIDHDTNITKFALLNYDEIKDQNDWNQIIRKRGNSYARDSKRNIDSYNLIEHLVKNKDKFLKEIPTEDILSTQYHNKLFDNEDLQYNESQCCEINEPTKVARSGYDICYFDFETITNTDKHTPYLCCSIINNYESSFYGESCGKKFINWVKNICQKDKIADLLLVAHNLRYDYTFIKDHVYALKPIFKGNRIMGGTGKIYYNVGDKRETVTIHFLDSCNLINSKLSGFGKMFNLDQGKEILPYSMYTEDNVNERFLSLEKVLSYIKADDHGQFLENVKKWNCGDDDIDIIEYSEQYCKIDCRVLKQGFETFRTWINETTNLDVKNYCSIASLGLDYIITQGCLDGCLKICGRPREFIQRCVVGGRCMTRDNKKWKVTGKEVADFDAVSLYPSAMSRMAGFLKGRPKIIENKTFEWLEDNSDGYFVKVLCLNNPTKKLGFPLLSKEVDGIRNFTNETKNEIFYIDKTCYEDCVKYQGLEFKILCGYYYNEGRNNKINTVIRHLFSARIEAKKNKNPIQAIYKLLMNSCYGKCLLKPIDTDIDLVPEKKWEDYFSRNYNFIRDYRKMKGSYCVNKIKPINEHFNNVYAGVEILTMSKRIMNEVMCLADDLKLNIYYTDTDSMHIDNNQIEILEKEYNKIHGRELIGKNMGQFHTDFDLGQCKDVIATESIFLGKKAYIDRLVGDLNGEKQYGFHIRMKGINEEGILHYAETYQMDVLDIYRNLYENGQIEGSFDLLAGGKCCKFQYNDDMSVSSVNEFTRKVTFNYEKGITCF